MDFWKKQIKDGNRLFNSRQYTLSTQVYKKALKRACYLFRHWDSLSKSVDSLIVSHLSLCDSLLQEQKLELAGNTLLQGHRIIETLLNRYELEQENYTYLLKAKTQFTDSIASLMEQNPEINVCDCCYMRIFGYSKELNRLSSMN